MAARKNPYTLHPGFARMGGRMAEAGMEAKSYLANAPAYVDAQYGGKKAALRPIYDRLLEVCLGLAQDVTASPGKTIVPIYRTHVIAQIKATTNSRIDFGLALKDTKAPKRLIDTGGFQKKDRITHRIEVTSLEDIDADLKKWLRAAYDMDA
jgi:hypothetical protein